MMISAFACLNMASDEALRPGVMREVSTMFQRIARSLVQAETTLNHLQRPIDKVSGRTSDALSVSGM